MICPMCKAQMDKIYDEEVSTKNAQLPHVVVEEGPYCEPCARYWGEVYPTVYKCRNTYCGIRLVMLEPEPPKECGHCRPLTEQKGVKQ